MIGDFIRRKSSSIVAVIGTGRSGTHLVGQLIATSKKVTPSIEDDELFPLITKAAVNNSRKDIPRIIKTLKKRSEKCQTDIYLEKSHPLLWFVKDKELAKLNIKYMGIIRDPYATVASMLKHRGVRKWCEDWDKFPQPNPFFGTTEENKESYKKMSLTGKCTMRWISHTKELIHLESVLAPDEYLLVHYEDLLTNHDEIIQKIENFLGINDIDKKFIFNPDSLNKWENDLSSEQKNEINKTIAKYYKDISMLKLSKGKTFN